MSFFNSLVHGPTLSEIFLEGHNPHALQKLETADVDAFRQMMHTSEALQAYVIGRVVGSGRGVWALTDQAILVINAGVQGATSLALADVQKYEAERGRFGHTVRLFLQDGSRSLYGVDRELAGDLHRVFQSRGMASQYDNRPARTHQWQAAPTPDWAQDCLRDAQMRLSPA